MNRVTAQAIVSIVAIVVVGGSTPCLAQTDSSSHTERFVQANGVAIHVLDWGGAGPNLVFLTGFGDTAHTFDSIADHFRRRFRVLAMTRRGRAPSSQPATGYDKDTLTADVVAALDALEIQRAHLVGASIAGIEMTEIARQYPGRVLSVVYLDAAIDAADAARVMKLDPLAPPPSTPGSQSAQIDLWWETYSPDFAVLKSPALAFFAMQSRHPYVPADASDGIRIKADAYWATEAKALVERMVAKFRREAKLGEAVLLLDASHHLYQDKREDVVKRMDAFYQQISK
jgi:pimeloyl-ACP methyl ester carboxylesterase